MRSTMTRYGGASPIFVPPNFTISAVTPDFLPSSLTACMTAGGNENSRPHNKPTISGSVGFERAFAMTSVPHAPLRPTYAPLRRCAFLDPHRRRPRLVDHVLDDGLQIVRLVVHAELSI